MKKKARFLLLLATGILTASSLTGCGKVGDLAQNDTYGADGRPVLVEETKAITVDEKIDPRVKIVVADHAKPGEVVELTVNADATKIVIEQVTVNGAMCAKKAEGQFYFVMPEVDAVISVATVSAMYYDIVNENPEVVLVGLPEGGSEGDAISFKVDMDIASGYFFTGDLDVTSANEFGDFVEPVAVDFDEGSEVYSFVMPDGEVHIHAYTEARLFPIEKVSGDNNVVSVKIVTGIDGDGNQILNDITYRKFAEYESLIQVTLKDTDAALAIGVALGEEEGAEVVDMSRVPDENGNINYVVNFIMPARGVVLKSVVVPNYISVGLESTETFTIQAFNKLEDGTYEEMEDVKAVPNSEFYVKVSGTEGAKGLRRVQAQYNGSTTTNLSLNSDGYYPVTMKNYNDFKIVIQEADFTPIAITQAAHLSLKTYNKVGDEYEEITGSYADRTVYVKVEGASEDYSFNKIDLSYVNAYGNEVTSTITSSSSNTDGYYSFKMNEGTNYALVLNEFEATTVTCTPSTNIALESFKQSGEEYVAWSKFLPGDTVYLKATPASDTYKVNAVTVTIGEGSPSAITSTSNGYYTYKIPTSDYQNIVFGVTEKTAGMYKGKSFVGDYIGYNIWGSNKIYDVGGASFNSGSAGGSIDDEGNMKVRSGTLTSTISLVDETKKIITSVNGSTTYLAQYNADGLLFTSFKGTSIVGTDDNMMMMKLAEGKVLGDYSFRSVTGSAKEFQVAEILCSGTVVTSFFIDVTNKVNYLDGVTLVPIEEGKNIATGSFNVLVDGVELGTCTKGSLSFTFAYAEGKGPTA